MKVISAILSLSLLSACAGAGAATRCPEVRALPAAHGAALAIGHASVYVDDQDRALRFYTEVLGFTTKDDVRNGPYRWLTVASADAPEGAELQLALDDAPAAKAYREAMLQAGQPAAMFTCDDLVAAYERLKGRGAELTMPPTEVMPGTSIAQLKDTCGNLIQLTQLAR